MTCCEHKSLQAYLTTVGGWIANKKVLQVVLLVVRKETQAMGLQEIQKRSTCAVSRQGFQVFVRVAERSRPADEHEHWQRKTVREEN